MNGTWAIIMQIKQEVLGRTNRVICLLRNAPHTKRRVHEFLYCWMCIRCRGNVFTERLPKNEIETHMQTYRLMGGIYEVPR
jgi:hypothetical protein